MSDGSPPSPTAAPAQPVSNPRPGVRWWPALVILLLAIGAYGVLRFLPHRSQQHLNINVAQVILLSFFALLLWLLFLSRIRWRTRLAIAGGVIGSLALVGATFRIRGVTGNLLPILEPRWTKHSWQQPPAATAGNSASGPVSGTPPLGRPAIPGAADFPQFLGPNRNAILSGPRLATNWTEQPPALLWRHPVGAAWSGFAVSGPFAITQEQRGEEELVVAYDLLTGSVRWSHADATRYFTTLAGEGPRATPTIAGTSVLVQGATGLLNCLDLDSGRVIWSKDIFKENQGHMPGWGHSSSPLVLGDRVVVNAGGHHDRSLVAYQIADGSVAWAGGKEGATYSSPTLATIDGVNQILLFADALVGHDAANGQLLWSFPWPGGHPHIAMPIVAGPTDVILSSGYGTGSGRVRVQRAANGSWSAKPVWRTNRMKAKFTNLILQGGYLYGLDDGILACLNAETGDLKWKDGKYGHGQMLLVGGILLVMAENGDVVLVDPNPNQLHELTRFSALHGKTWNPPALAGEYLVVRNDQEAACFRVPVVRSPSQAAP